MGRSLRADCHNRFFQRRPGCHGCGCWRRRRNNERCGAGEDWIRNLRGVPRRCRDRDAGTELERSSRSKSFDHSRPKCHTDASGGKQPNRGSCWKSDRNKRQSDWRE